MKSPPRSPPSFGLCTLQSLLAWLSKERELHAQMRGELSPDGIRRSLAYFQVARSFPGIGKGGTGLAKIQHAIEKSDTFDGTPAERVAYLARDLEKAFGTHMVSAASKLLWLRHRSPFVIYDARAVTALSMLTGSFDKRSYADYYEHWHLAYRNHKGEIRAAVTGLAQLHDQMRPLMIPEWTKKEMAGAWFSERVFDLYLWMLGQRE